MEIYIQKALVLAGLGSRRNGEKLVKEGRVRINGELAELGEKADVDKDKIKVDGRLVKIEEKRVYYLVNKPVGYTCTLRDRFASKKVISLVPKSPKVWPVGRLDQSSRGLIILTNDGELTHELTHPSFKHEKEYEVELDKNINIQLITKLKKGIKLEEGIAKIDKIRKLEKNKLIIILHQGWKRQIRRMMKECGYRVVDLKRVRVGKWKLSGLEEGKYKKINL